MEEPIYVTKPFLPPLAEFLPYLEDIWQNRILTNGGKFHEQLERELAEFLGVPYISLFANGTLALNAAIGALKLKGEVITTPYSFVATTHALMLNNLKPVFADINPATGNLAPESIAAKITKKTSAILPVHVYGIPSDTDAILSIAKQYKLRTIFDGAHAFGVKLQNKSILNFGDLSILSFHATKCFNTFEGGAVICHDIQMKTHLDQLKNFGFIDEVTIQGVGSNAKMSEFQAALGLLQLKYFDKIRAGRKKVTTQYKQELSSIPGIRFFEIPDDVFYNYAYMPVIIDQSQFGASRDTVYSELKKHHIYTRRYFYPLISNLPPYQDLPSSNPEQLPEATRLSQEILCLPIYPDLKKSTIQKISRAIQNVRSGHGG